ncbi:hypothetical protein Tco_0271546 [Tanacetum coccineum]
MPALDDISIFDFSRGDEDDDAETDMNNLEYTIKSQDCKHTNGNSKDLLIDVRMVKGGGMVVHMYRSMIGSLMYLTSSRPDIMFVVCACARYQVNPKVSHLHHVKRIFRYLKGQPKLGLWYLKDSPFDLVAYTDSDYTGASLNMKSTTGGCQFLGSRLISWQCKKQTVVANSTTEAEYVAGSQVVWSKMALEFQYKLLDYGYNFMHTMDYNEKKLIQMAKIHIDKNVTDLLTKAFDIKKAKKSVRLTMEKLVIRENRQRVLVRKRIERIGENKNRKRAVWNKNRYSDLVSKRIERSGELKNRKRVEYIKNRHSVWNGIGVNAGDSKLILLGTNLLLLVKVNAARHKLTTAEQFLSTVKVKTVNGEVQLQLPSWMERKIIIAESNLEENLQLEDAESGLTKHVVDEVVYKELDDSLVRVATTASSLEAEQDSGNIAKTQSKATPNESSSLGTTLGGGPKRQETIGDTITQTRFENVSKHSNDTLLARGNTLQSGEDSLKHNELMELCTNLQTRVLDLEKTKTIQAEKIVSLKRREHKKTMITYLKNMEDLVEGSSKQAGDKLEQEVTKKQKVDDVYETTEVDDDSEAAKIKELMEIVPDEEEVAIHAIHLATKPPTIVDWKIHKKERKTITRSSELIEAQRCT